MDDLCALLLELDKLKAIYRKSTIAEEPRRENTAEHSWHLAVALMAVQDRLPEGVDFQKALKMALVHDVCEIGAGDVCAYHEDDAKAAREEAYLSSLQSLHPDFGHETLSLWLEFEEQESAESRWVKAIDKLLPFVLNLATDGKTWREQGITRGMVLKQHSFIQSLDPELHSWLNEETDAAVKKGWLPNA
jgi:putative hydrolase of HD superfamily